MKYRFEIKIYFYMKPLTLSDLRTRQAWPLNQKIDHTCYAMETFVAYCKEHDRTPYVSFSGGLNSTVLLDLARRFVDPNMKGVFCSTGNEYPEIVRFVRHTDNIEIIHPAMPPREVMARYGFPLVSKEQAQAVRNIRTTNSDKLRTYRLYGDGVRRAGVLSEKWRYLISEPYMTSEKCCEILKKRPFRKFNAQTQSLGMVGTMADESKLRQTMYVRRGGCNVFSDNPRKVHSRGLPGLHSQIRHTLLPDLRHTGHYPNRLRILRVRRTPRRGGRFHILYTLHPKLYQMAMNYTNNGYTLRYALRRMGVQLPDEHPELF